jgi:hypothetical protein
MRQLLFGGGGVFVREKQTAARLRDIKNPGSSAGRPAISTDGVSREREN